MYEIKPGDKVMLHNEEEYFEVYRTVYGCGRVGIVIGSGRLELSDGREVSVFEVKVHYFLDLEDHNWKFNYYQSMDYRMSERKVQ